MQNFVIDSLATYRLSRLVTTDTITEPVRNKIWDKFSPQETKLGYLITCNWCTSIWMGAGVAVARELAPKTWNVAATALAASAVTGIISDRT